MDPYEVLGEYSHLQGQDMSTLGFMQDLIRGLNKIIKKGEPTLTNEVCEQVLNINTEEPAAYLIKLMIDFEIHTEKEFSKLIHIHAILYVHI